MYQQAFELNVFRSYIQLRALISDGKRGQQRSKTSPLGTEVASDGPIIQWVCTIVHNVLTMHVPNARVSGGDHMHYGRLYSTLVRGFFVELTQRRPGDHGLQRANIMTTLLVAFLQYDKRCEILAA